MATGPEGDRGQELARSFFSPHTNFSGFSWFSASTSALRVADGEAGSALDRKDHKGSASPTPTSSAVRPR